MSEPRRRRRQVLPEALEIQETGLQEEQQRDMLESVQQVPQQMEPEQKTTDAAGAMRRRRMSQSAPQTDPENDGEPQVRMPAPDAAPAAVEAEPENGAVFKDEKPADAESTVLNLPIRRKKKVPALPRIAGILICVAAIALLLSGVTELDDSQLEFYIGHYQTCLEGYNDSIAMSRSYSSGFFRNSYQSIADSYQDMMRTDAEGIQKYLQSGFARLGGGALLLLAGVCLMVGSMAQRIVAMLVVVVALGVASGNLYVGGKHRIPLVKAAGMLSDGKVTTSSVRSSVSVFRPSYTPVPRTGNAGALAKAKSYLNSSAFSYSGLIKQLEYEGFTSSQAKYGADNCGANWNEQAVKKAKSYLRSIPSMTRSKLLKQLEYEGFTYSQASYGVSHSGI